MVVITEREIKETIEKIVEEIFEFPEVGVDKLYQIASIFLTIGICKKSPAFKLLSDHIFLLPAKLKPVMVYAFQLTGAGELKDKYSSLVENVKKELREVILLSLNALSKTEIDEVEVLTIVDRLRDAYMSLPYFRET